MNFDSNGTFYSPILPRIEWSAHMFETHRVYITCPSIREKVVNYLMYLIVPFGNKCYQKTKKK